MPLELVAVAPRSPVLREYEEPELQPDQVRIKSTFSSPKHGTEQGFYEGISPFNLGTYDEEMKIFLPRKDRGGDFPVRLGNMTIGTVIEVGKEAKRFKVGDQAFGHLPIAQTHAVTEDQLHAVPAGMSPEAIVCLDPAEFALGAVRDAHVRLGDKVAIFGMGAIGLMVLQMVKLSGAAQVIVVDPLPLRRETALRLGAHMALDPEVIDVGLEIKRATGGNGADVAIEASGSYSALHEAIRCAAYGSRVTPLAFYLGEGKGLRLGDEWHMNRIILVSSRACSDPNPDHPAWDDARIVATCFTMLRDGKLTADGIVTPIVPLEKSAEAYRLIVDDPSRMIKLGVSYPD